MKLIWIKLLNYGFHDSFTHSINLEIDSLIFCRKIFLLCFTIIFVTSAL